MTRPIHARALAWRLALVLSCPLSLATYGSAVAVRGHFCGQNAQTRNTISAEAMVP